MKLHGAPTPPAAVARQQWDPATDGLAPSWALNPVAGRSYDAWRLLREPVAQLYPGGRGWLASRLEDIDAGSARGRLLLARCGCIAGGILETPKGTGRLKVSTLYVSPRWRRRGAGRLLLADAASRWTRERLAEVYITGPADVDPALDGSLSSVGFHRRLVLPHRYGEQRHEAVWSWAPAYG